MGGGAHLGIAPAEPHRAQETRIGAIERRQETLRQPERQGEAHLRQPLQRRRARAALGPGIRRAGEVAEAQRGVIMGRPDQAVEVDLSDHPHKPSAIVPSTTSASRLATGHAA